MTILVENMHFFAIFTTPSLV